MFDESVVLDGLNERQRRAAAHQGGPLLVLAGAGTGKTRTLVARAAWLRGSHAARATSVLVFPVPAPASTSSGPPWWVTARRCCSFSPSSTALSSNMHLNITSRTAADPYAAPAAFGRPGAGHRSFVTDSDNDPGPQPSRGDKRWYFGLMATCIGLFVLSWAVIGRYSTLAAVIVSAVALAIPPFAVIVANVASASDRRRR